MTNDFDPSRLSITVDCGELFTGGDRGPTALALRVRVRGDGEITVALYVEQRGRSILAIMGATGWPALVAAVKEAEKRIAQLKATGKADEFAICKYNEP